MFSTSFSCLFTVLFFFCFSLLFSFPFSVPACRSAGNNRGDVIASLGTPIYRNSIVAKYQQAITQSEESQRSIHCQSCCASVTLQVVFEKRKVNSCQG
ncbi:hypothetical protein BDV25DRAFT_59450 [Aspergillus avenaceus]|uniref:Secreted protein n=1 Tax=Aspergillus avenaceus TaxID=36643 RepID=A0A5N6THX9_ASPAV|nr:hypothetical protein BDV25DRAFT_59450 [Aspergillus avenaceus]